eukprot:3712885-Rhodomonas_salina.1
MFGVPGRCGQRRRGSEGALPAPAPPAFHPRPSNVLSVSESECVYSTRHVQECVGEGWRSGGRGEDDWV